MTNKYIGTIIGIILILGVGGFVYSQKDSDIKQQTPTPTNSTVNSKTDSGVVTQTTNSDSKVKSYTMSNVAVHNNKQSCWSVIDGSVFDLTSWVPNHPGGERAILSICGIDGSSRFNGQHGGNSQIAKILMGFKIGILAQ